MLRLSESKVLAVDDTETNIDILVDTLGDIYDLRVALSGQSALEQIEDDPPDIILLDIMMPEMNGYQVLNELNRRDIKIPVIFITAMDELEFKTKGFEIGAVDYITKPFHPLEVIARVKTHLSLKIAMDELGNQNEILEQKVSERTKQLQTTQDVTIRSLSALAETRDNETGNHIIRTQNYVELLALELRKTEKYAMYMNEQTIDLLKKSAPLHDIGKVGIPDRILLKPGKLTDKEFEIMKMHAKYGYDALEKASNQLGTNTFLDHAMEIAWSHHEKWDGSGYPRALKEAGIPIEGRLMAVADVYDALISKRVYKPPFLHTKAVSIILEGKGTHFDPDIVDAFINISEGFREIALKLVEHDEEREALNR
ncbi:MAG: response regulator [Spirochaetales bacterium]|nr:response regulator [Spirochaetales bacterium]